MSIKQLTKSIYYLPPSKETDRPILAAVYGEQYTLMMDAGNSPNHANSFLQKIAGKGLNKPDFVMFTHGHWDHILGYTRLDIPSFAHALTKKYMATLLELKWDNKALSEQVQKGITTAACSSYIKKEYGESRESIQIKLPTITFSDEVVIDLGGLTCVLKHVGGDHAKDSSILYIKEEKVLFIGDSISPCIHSPKRYYKLHVITQLLEKLESFDAEIVIHSHGSPMNKQQFKQEINEYRDIIELVNKFGVDIDIIIKHITQRWKRELPEEDIDFIQYFINGLEL